MFGLGKTKETPIKHCNIYMHLTEDSAIVSEVHKTYGLLNSIGGSKRVSTLDPLKFGEAVTDAFHRFQLVPFDNNSPEPPTQRKSAPALEASGLKSRKAFDREYMRISMAGANSANIIYLLQTNYVVDEVRLSASCGNSPEVLGSHLLMLKRYYKQFAT